MRPSLKFLIAVVVITLGILVYLSHLYNQFINTAPDDKKIVKIIDIKHGESPVAIFEKLEREGVISSAKKFYYYGRLAKKIDEVKYGEYEFTTSMKPFEVLGKLVMGDVKKYKITIPEGYNLYQAAEVLAEQLMVKRDDFLEKSHDKGYARALGVPADMLEGYLFPDTYYFTKDTQLDEIIKKMVENYKRNFNDRMREKAKALKMTENEIVTLASIIEKETSVPEEMPRISAVFHNRLKKKMRLQSDPTIIYGIKDFNGNITKKDLETKTPYNTYRINGLPPTPIANPGREALVAALSPEKSNYLYFVSMNNGTHYFSDNIDEHNKAVYKYQVKGEKASDRSSAE